MDENCAQARRKHRLSTRWLARISPVSWLVPVVTFSFLLAYLIRFDGVPPEYDWANFQAILPWLVAAKTIAFLVMRLTLSCHAFVSLHDAFRLLRATFVGSATVAVVDALLITGYSIPRGVVIIDGCLTALLVGGVLSLRRAYRERSERRQHPATGRRVLIVSGPLNGEVLLRAVRSSRTEKFDVVGILTDQDQLQHRAIAGVPVVGRLSELATAITSRQAEMVLLSNGDLPGSVVRKVVEVTEISGVAVRIIPDVSKIISGQIDFRPREVAIEDLLGRPTVAIDQSGLLDWLSGKRVLVTGSCGSIGSEIVRQLLPYRPAHLAMLDRNENGQFHLGRELQRAIDSGSAEIVLADVTDMSRMNAIFRKYKPEVVFHAAAYKHVPMMEHHPGEGVKNIVGATKNLADLSHACGVDTFVMISTDKAVNPTNVMGCCKRVAELYVQSMADKSPCKFVTVRFGNVLGSAGSVIPIFREQIAQGGPVTVTHPEMTRFFMTIPEASQLVIQAGYIGAGGEIFVLDMGAPVKIMDLARDMIHLSGLRVDDDIEIKITGLRSGEKLYEELYSDEETQSPTSHEKILKAQCVRVSNPVISQSVNQLLAIHGNAHEDIYNALQEIVPSFQPTKKFATPQKTRFAASRDRYAA